MPQEKLANTEVPCAWKSTKYCYCLNNRPRILFVFLFFFGVLLIENKKTQLTLQTNKTKDITYFTNKNSTYITIVALRFTKQKKRKKPSITLLVGVKNSIQNKKHEKTRRLIAQERHRNTVKDLLLPNIDSQKDEEPHTGGLDVIPLRYRTLRLKLLKYVQLEKKLNTIIP